MRGFSAPGKCPTRKITGLEREALAVIIIIITRPKRQGLRIGWYPGPGYSSDFGRVLFGVLAVFTVIFCVQCGTLLK